MSDRVRLVIFWLVWLMGASPAVAGDTWDGKIVFPKDSGVRIGHTDAKGKQVFLAELTLIDYVVIEERAGWLKVNHNGVEGWFDKAMAVPLESAVDYFTGRIRANPREAFWYNKRAIAWRRKGEPDIAVKDLNEAIRLLPRDTALWINRGLVWLEDKFDDDRAINDFSEAIRFGPNQAQPYRCRGIAWKNKKEFDRAITDLDHAIRLFPNDSIARLARGDCWFAKKEYAKAKKDFEETVQICEESLRTGPNSEKVLARLAWLLSTCPVPELRDGAKAEKLAKRACELTAFKNGGLLDTLAAAHAETGDFDAAIRVQAEAIQLLAYSDTPDYKSRLALYRTKTPYRTAQPQVPEQDALTKRMGAAPEPPRFPPQLKTFSANDVPD